jgi:hypothetical protein
MNFTDFALDYYLTVIRILRRIVTAAAIPTIYDHELPINTPAANTRIPPITTCKVAEIHGDSM